MKNLLFVILLVVIAGLCVLAVTNHDNTNSNQTQVEDKWVTLAKTLTAKEAKMYGTSWCGHCNAQKEMFGNGWQYITYVECSDAKNPNIQTTACATADIEAYPTWIFGDGSRQTGKLSYEELSAKVR